MAIISRRVGCVGFILATMVCSPALQAKTLELSVTGADGEPLRYAVAYVESPDLEVQVEEESRPDGEVDQRDGQFMPHSQVLQRGTAARFPNNDQVRHHVFSFSDAKSFELPLFADEAPRPIHFDTAGVVVLGCNIHDHMIGHLLIVDTPIFGNADEHGLIRLDGVPDHAEATLRVWHPELGEDDMGITVEMNGDAALDVSMDVTDTPPPEPPSLRDRRRDLQDRFD